MFVQIHMLQSMPPCNLNRDGTGQPKHCIFGGVTRGRISSQCLKRSIRWSLECKDAFGGPLAVRTKYIAQMVADELKGGKFGVFGEEELGRLMAAIRGKFNKGDKEEESEDGQEDDEEQATPGGSPSAEGKEPKKSKKKPQLVFFPRPFAADIARLVANFREEKPRAYSRLIGGKVANKKEREALDKEIRDSLEEEVHKASKKLTVDIGLFGRMTTSNLVENVDAACQVAHAISTHETIIEQDWFTAMDDEQRRYASGQAEMAGAAFIGSEDNVTFFNSAVYYKYMNLDVDSLRKHVSSLTIEKVAEVAGAMVSAAALTSPTGKQNSFAAYGVPEFIMVEVSAAKRPVSYANAFLQAVEGPNFMAESAKALQVYVDSVAAAFEPPDVRRVLLAVGNAKVSLGRPHTPVSTLGKLVESMVTFITDGKEPGATE